jgi:PKD repeat protein
MKPPVMRHFFVLLFISCCWIASADAATHCIWFADSNAIYQVDTDTNQIVQTVAVKDVQSLAMNGSDCSVTALMKKQLARFDGNGMLLQTIDLQSLNKGLGDVQQLVIDPFDNSVWLHDEKTVVHLNANGQFTGSFITPSAIRSTVLAMDESIWMLGNKQLSHYSAKGALLASQDLKKLIDPEPKLLAIDSVGGLLWFAGEKQLVQINLNQTGQATLNINLPSVATSLTLNPLTGELWVATTDRLQSYGRDGTLHNTADLKTSHVNSASQLAFDPVTQTLWVLSDHAINRLSGQGQLLMGLPTQDNGTALVVPAFTVIPALSLKHPAPNGFTNNALTTITYGFYALCNNQSCAFAPSYFSSYNLSATLNKQSITPFVFDGTIGQSGYTPMTRLPEGLNALSAQTTDRFGHASKMANDVFTVDTIPPKFLSISPADGSVVTTSNILLQGVVDDPIAIVVLQGAGMAMNNTVVGATLKFSMPVVLAQGLNTFVLSAIDKAGNTTTVALRITYNPVSFTVTNPANGATVGDNTILVTGTFMAPNNTGITVNGVVATQIGNQYFAQVPLQPGVNILAVIATTATGVTVTQTINVVSSGVSPMQVSASAVNGIAPLTVNFIIQNNTTNTIANIDADFNGDGVSDLTTFDPAVPLQFTYTKPGTYIVHIGITDSAGNTTTSTQAIVVQSVTSIDNMLRGIYVGMLDNLKNGNVDGALTAVTAGVYEKYKAVFNTLKPKLPFIVDQLGTIQDGTIGNKMAEYVIMRNTSSGPQGFLMYFILGEDGVWRIDAM